MQGTYPLVQPQVANMLALGCKVDVRHIGFDFSLLLSYNSIAIVVTLVATTHTIVNTLASPPLLSAKAFHRQHRPYNPLPPGCETLTPHDVRHTRPRAGAWAFSQRSSTQHSRLIYPHLWCLVQRVQSLSRTSARTSNFAKTIGKTWCCCYGAGANGPCDGDASSEHKIRSVGLQKPKNDGDDGAACNGVV